MKPLIAFLAAIALVGCRPSLPRSRFGSYERETKTITLSSGATMKVYRIKYWTFQDGSAPALQLEYEPPFSVADTNAVRRAARELWPSFAPYVEANGLSSAIITATNLQWKGIWPVAWSAHTRSFTIILMRDSAGEWYADGDTVRFPAADLSSRPSITEASGAPVPLRSVLR